MLARHASPIMVMLNLILPSDSCEHVRKVTLSLDAGFLISPRPSLVFSPSPLAPQAPSTRRRTCYQTARGSGEGGQGGGRKGRKGAVRGSGERGEGEAGATIVSPESNMSDPISGGFPLPPSFPPDSLPLSLFRSPIRSSPLHLALFLSLCSSHFCCFPARFYLILTHAFFLTLCFISRQYSSHQHSCRHQRVPLLLSLLLSVCYHYL